MADHVIAQYLDSTAFELIWDELEKVGEKGSERIVIKEDKITTAAKITLGQRLINCIKWLFCCGGDELHERVARFVDVSNFLLVNKENLKLKHLRGLDQIAAHYGKTKMVVEKTAQLKTVVFNKYEVNVISGDKQVKELEGEINKANFCLKVLKEKSNAIEKEHQLNIEKLEKQIGQLQAQAQTLRDQSKQLSEKADLNNILQLEEQAKQCESAAAKLVTELNQKDDLLKDSKAKEQEYHVQIDELEGKLKKFDEQQQKSDNIKKENDLLDEENQKQKELLNIERCTDPSKGKEKLTDLKVSKQKLIESLEFVRKSEFELEKVLIDKNDSVFSKCSHRIQQERLARDNFKICKKIQALENQEQILREGIDYHKKIFVEVVCSDRLLQVPIVLLKKIPVFKNSAQIGKAEEEIPAHNKTIDLSKIGIKCNSALLIKYFTCLKRGESYIKIINSFDDLIELYWLAITLCGEEEDAVIKLLGQRIIDLIKDKEDQFSKLLLNLKIYKYSLGKELTRQIFKNDNLFNELPEYILIAMLAQVNIDFLLEDMFFEKLKAWIDLRIGFDTTIQKLWAGIHQKPLSNFILIENLDKKWVDYIRDNNLLNTEELKEWDEFLKTNENPPQRRLRREIIDSKAVLFEDKYILKISLDSFIKLENLILDDNTRIAFEKFNIYENSYRLILGEEYQFELDGVCETRRAIIVESLSPQPLDLNLCIDEKFFPIKFNGNKIVGYGFSIEFFKKILKEEGVLKFMVKKL